MLSWEYPPKNIGGLSNHVYYISHSLNKLGHEVHVVTCQEGTAPIKENDKGVFIHRVESYNIPTEDFTKWVMQLNFAMIEECIRLIVETGSFDIIHGHDWLTAYALKSMKWGFSIPAVCTMHATEHGRNNGIRTAMQRYIASCEAMLVYECDKVVVCSHYMREQINNLFSTSWDKIEVIPNGIDGSKFQGEFGYKEIRKRYAEDDEKIVFFIGRHVHEKGIQVLIDSIPSILEAYEKIKFVIGGDGPMTLELRDRVQRMKLNHKVIFTGYMEEEDKINSYKVADAAIFPSLYEPFGIVVLEAMAAGCPVVASDIGGITEIINHKTTGMKFMSSSISSLKENLISVLMDKELSSRLTTNGKLEIEKRYSWDKAATSTLDVYDGRIMK
jgi:glycosyltransferase involved in cell wall biosynthesis